MTGPKSEILFHGCGVASGITLGTAVKLDSHQRVELKTSLVPDQLESEVNRFRAAVEASRRQMAELKVSLEEKVGKEHAFVIDAHILMLEDRSLLAEIEGIIRSECANSEWAVRKAAATIQQAYQSLEDEYFRERASDIEYVVERILINLAGSEPFDWDHLAGDLVIVAHDFSPSSFAAVDLERIRGLALESGGRSSHSAIIARSLCLPSVMQIPDFVHFVSTGDAILVNGDEGEVVVNPREERVAECRARIEESGMRALPGPGGAALPAATRDGATVSLRANTELPHEVRVATACGAEGIGLFRSEFLFFAHSTGFPSSEDQYLTYRMLVEAMAPHPVAIRTLDTGAEQIWTGSDLSGCANPSMGLRGIRLSLRTRDLFRAQVEAILRAAQFGSVEMIFPMVSTVEEIWRAKEVVREVGRSLSARDGAAVDVSIGAMIEVPAAVLMLESIAREVDVLCVGTNDLTQYLMAVDRDNPEVANLFQPLHPSIVQCLQRIAEVSNTLGRPARICGEISANPLVAVLLVGMGFRQLSMNPRSMAIIRKTVSSIRVDAAERLAERILRLSTTQEIVECMVAEVSRILPLDLGQYVREITNPVLGDGSATGFTPGRRVHA